MIRRRIATRHSLEAVPRYCSIAGALPNTRLKLAAPVVYGRIAFVIIPVRRRGLGAPR